MIKLILILAVILFIFFVFWILTPEYEKCYSDREKEGYAVMGCCGGLVGGTKATDYLSETCIDCPHLVLGCDPKVRKENNELHNLSNNT